MGGEAFGEFEKRDEVAHTGAWKDGDMGFCGNGHGRQERIGGIERIEIE